jgi:hypothetical protein
MSDLIQSPDAKLCVSCRKQRRDLKGVPARLDGHPNTTRRLICWACVKWADAQMTPEKAEA